MADGYLNFDTKINEKGFNEGISKLSGLASKGVGSVGNIVNKANGIITAISGSLVGVLVKDSLGVVANMEQQVGGVETLFKDSANTVIDNANRAYKTAGMSANNYMETVTSFSASLLQSLGGDTAKAASYADRAIVDMSDNANKMGTNMRDIQNAYQGFAKQNYTMLDNLKLGYGGTQEEMKRLISDASKLTDVQKELGITVDANSLSFGNIVNAISVVQKNMDIAGTTSKEAATTIEGSVNSAKAAWENFEAGVISANDLVDTFWTAGQNIFNNLGQIIPRLGKTGMDVVESLSGKIGEAVPQLKGFTDSVGKLADKLQNMSTDELMNLGKTAAVLAGAAPAFGVLGKGAGTCGDILNSLGDISGGVFAKLGKMPGDLKSLGASMKSGAKVFGNVKDAILLPFDDLAPKLTGVFQKALGAIGTGPIGKIVNDFAEIPKGIISAFGKIGPGLAKTFPKATAALKSFGSSISSTFGVIVNGAKGFGSLLGGAFGSVLSKVSGFGSQLMSYLGIIGNAFVPILSKVAGFIPSFISLLNFGAVAAVAVAGLGLVYSQFGTQIDQILLMVQTKGPEIISNFGAGITAALPGLISSGATLILGLMNAITANLPSLISVGASIIATLVSSLGAQLPQLIPAAVQMILTLVESLISNLPQLITSGLQLMEGLAQGIANAIPQVAAKAPVIIGKLASTIITNLPKIIQTGVKIITQLAVGLVQGIPALLGKIPSMISQIKNAFTSVNWGSVGMNIISGIASGISSAVGSLIGAATSAASSALDAIKSKLGIHSPSRVFRDQVGKMMALGMGIGFRKNIPVGSMNAGVQKAVQSLQRSVQLTTSVNPDKTVGGIKNNPIFKDQGFDYDRFERIQRKIAKENGNKPVFLDTKRIDRPLPKGAVPQV